MTSRNWNIVRAAAIDRKIVSDLFEQYVDGDIDFHRFIWERSGNSIRLKSHENTTAPLFEFMTVLTRAGLATWTSRP